MAEIICAVYKIINTVTGDFYIGSSKNVKNRWASHKNSYTWKKCPNNPMYQDIQKYGLDKFAFEILAEVEVEQLKEKEQQFIEMLQPTYNNYNAKGIDVKRRKKYKKEYQKEYYESNKEQILEQKKQYYESNKEEKLEQKKQYQNQLCFYNNETLTLHALAQRFQRAGTEHPTLEAKKYLIKD